MPGLLFVCTGNLYRSPLAAAFFSRKLRAEGALDGWAIGSAGTWTVPDRPVTAELLQAAAALGVDLHDHRTRQVDGELLARQDLVLVMEKGHREALSLEFPAVARKIQLLSHLADRLEYDIADPARAQIAPEKIVLDMFNLIERAYPTICRLIRTPGKALPPSRPHVNFTV